MLAQAAAREAIHAPMCRRQQSAPRKPLLLARLVRADHPGQMPEAPEALRVSGRCVSARVVPAATSHHLSRTARAASAVLPERAILPRPAHQARAGSITRSTRASERQPDWAAPVSSAAVVLPLTQTQMEPQQPITAPGEVAGTRLRTPISRAALAALASS